MNLEQALYAIELYKLYIAKMEAEALQSRSDLESATAEIGKLKTEVIRLTKVVVAPKVLLGISGRSDLVGAAERWFSNNSLTVAPRRTKASCPRVHASWKGTTALSDAQVIALFENLLDGDKVEIEHESDVKYRKAATAMRGNGLAVRLAAKDRFYAQVKRLREAGKIAQVDVVNTLSSYTWEINDAERFYAHADVVGADLDGGNFPKDYGDPDRLAKIVAYADKYYNGRWTAPEFGWSDTIVGKRMSTILPMIDDIAAFRPEEIQFFDSSSFSPVLTTAELNEYQDKVLSYNRT